MKQEKAMSVMMSGKNIMLTGSAGAGKTFLLNKFVNKARRHKKKVVVTATTGLAAAHLGGQTIHRWSGIGIEDKLHENYLYMISETRANQMRNTDVLIIDEISMMHDYNLDMIDEAMQMIRENSKPFGGLQVILCGDFFQLPPVSRNGLSRFVTSSRVWNKANFTPCYLEEQYRTEDDRLQDILNAMRAGDMRQKHLNWLLSRLGKVHDGKITKLYTTNKAVDEINNRELNKIQGDSHFYLRTSKGYDNQVSMLQSSVLAPELLELKKGALVMAVKNEPSGFFSNGSIGTVELFEDNLPVVKFRRNGVIPAMEWELRKGDKKVAGITQIPLKLAYAITVHKSQGMTLDMAEVDLSQAFVEGMGYVALSRVKSLDNLYLKGINQRSMMVSREAQEIDKELKYKSRSLL